MWGITRIPHAPGAMLYLQRKYLNYWLAAAVVYISMVRAVNTPGSAFEGPILSSRRLQNTTEEPGIPPPSIAGIFSNTFGESCKGDYLRILSATDSFDQLGSSAATTVMTLIPAMITFAAMPMASISSLKFINTQLALYTSALTLGLTIDVRSTLTKDKEKKVTDLISDPEVIKNCASDKEHDIHGMYELGGLSELHKCVYKVRLPIIYIIFTIACYSSLQVILFGTLVRALPKIEDILFIWACPGWSAVIFNAWLGVTAVLAAILRTINVSSFLNKDDEVLHVTPLPRTRLSDYCQECSATARVPRPRLSPPDRIRSAFSISFLHIFSLDQEFLHLKEIFKLYQRPHPMIIVLRKSPEATPGSTLTLAIHGFIQAISIVLLTFMFASMWGGSVMWTTLFVAAFMSIIWVSRTASLVVGEYLEHKTGMTVIYFSTDDERCAILRVLAAMPEALVEIRYSGFMYWDGHNLNGDCESHENSEFKRSKETETRVRSLGLIRGVITGFLIGIGVFFSFFVATLPYNAPFIPHPRDWFNYPVALVVSGSIAAAFWMDFAFQRSRLLLWSYFCSEINKLAPPINPNGDIEATGGRTSINPVSMQRNAINVEPKALDPEVAEIRK